VINRFLTEGVVNVVSSGLTRTWQPWADAAVFKASYMAVIIVTVVVLTLWMYRATGDEIYRLRASIILGISISLGAIAAGLGVAGYIERIPLLLLPFTALSLVETTRLPKQRGISRKIVVILMISLAMATSSAFFSGRNFQSIPTSEDEAREFLLMHTQNIAGLYPKINVTSIFTPLLTNRTLARGVIYVLSYHDFIQALYYSVGDILILNDYVHKFKSACNVVYSNPTTQLLRLISNC